METSITFENLVGMASPFKKRRLIFFKENSPAYEMYGENVYGLIRIDKTHLNPESIKAENQFIKIDAQVLNGYNKQLGDSRMTLYYKGVLFSEIDIQKSFPEPPPEMD